MFTSNRIGKSNATPSPSIQYRGDTAGCDGFSPNGFPEKRAKGRVIDPMALISAPREFEFYERAPEICKTLGLPEPAQISTEGEA